jgi:hypothetical protein
MGFTAVKPGKSAVKTNGAALTEIGEKPNSNPRRKAGNKACKGEGFKAGWF